MAASTTVNSVLRQAQKISEVWTANPTFILNDVTQKGFGDLQAAAAQLSGTVESRRIELQGLVNQRDDIVLELQTAITRARSGIRGFFGPDSSEYDQAGGKRTSERKSPGRRPAAKASASTK